MELNLKQVFAAYAAASALRGKLQAAGGEAAKLASQLEAILSAQREAEIAAVNAAIEAAGWVFVEQKCSTWGQTGAGEHSSTWEATSPWPRDYTCSADEAGEVEQALFGIRYGVEGAEKTLRKLGFRPVAEGIKAPEVTLDRANLAYQKALLRGEA